jgi:hypothetical protein
VKFRNYYINILIFFCLLSCLSTKAQQNSDVSLIIGEKNISLEDPFVVTVVLKFIGESPNPEYKFPELPNFTKRGVSKSIARSYVSGQPVATCTITQNYAAKKEGVFKIPAFKVNVNGTDLKQEALSIKVSKTVTSGKKDANNTELNTGKATDNQEDFTDFIEGNSPELANLNTKEDAFLSLSSSKSTPYVGQGFTVTLAFYVAKSNTAEIEFDQNSTQIPIITKKIKPENCWEESFGITEVQEAQVSINGKQYTQYKLYQSTFYPLNDKKIVFPSVSLRLLKFLPEKNGGKKSTYVTFQTGSFTVKAKELPPHPLKNEVSVGEFTWRETLNKHKIITGKSVEYSLQIMGDGYNVKLPQIKNDSVFDFFPPEVDAINTPQNNKIISTKSFTFQIIPKRAGNFVLDKYFQWVYFNTKTEKYDTLKSVLKLEVSGQAIQTADSPLTQTSVYDGLENTDSSEEASDFKKILKDEANILIVIMLIGLIYIFIPNRKNK